MSSAWRRAGTAVLLLALMALAFGLRVAPLRAAVLTPEGVRFQGPDSWYHMRVADHVAANFPHLLRHDPYALQPGGQAILPSPLFDLLLGGVGRIASRDGASPQRADIAAAYVPPVLGALVLLPVFLIGRLLFGATAGLLGAGVLAVLPGELLHRSMIGHTDQHVLEALLAASAMALLMAAIAGTRPAVEAGHREMRRRVGFALLAGVALSAYFLTWSGAALIIAAVLIWMPIQALVDHDRPRRPQPLFIVLPALVMPAIAVALLHGWLRRTEVSLASLAAALAAGMVIPALGAWVRSRGRGRLGLLLAGAAVAAVLSLAVALVAPFALEATAREVWRFVPVDTGRGGVTEATPLLFGGPQISLLRAWLQLATPALLAPIAFLLLLRVTAREPRPERLLFLAWTVVVLAATFGQIRFFYYLAVPAAVLSGGAAADLLRIAGLTGARSESAGRRVVLGVMGIAALVLLVYLPPLRIADATLSDNGPTPQWDAAMRWMRQHTPEPFGNANEYLARWSAEPPSAAYGVVTWWDFGYLVTRLGRRVPTANPTQAGAIETASFYLAENERDARAILKALRARYVIVDRSLAFTAAPGEDIAQGLFPALPRWAKQPAERFFEVMLEERGAGGEVGETPVYHAPYYHAMLNRLLFQRGAARTDAGPCWVLEVAKPTGSADRRRIRSRHRFERYDDAMSALASYPAGTALLAGLNPMTSCFPLPALEGFTEVFAVPAPAPDPVPELLIFEHRAGS